MKLYYKDKLFFRRLFALLIPILLQNLLTATLNFIDNLMIGRLEGIAETAVAAVGIVNNSIFFIYIMLSFGLASASGIFNAQYWGAKQIDKIKVVTSFSLILTFIVSFIFIGLSIFIPDQIIAIFTIDQEVISAGVPYLQIITPTFFMLTVAYNYSTVLRSTEIVIFPMIASITGLILNTSLNYLLIFGNFGFPELGVRGAGYATLIARSVEFTMVISYAYIKKTSAAIGIKDFFSVNKEIMIKYLKKALPLLGQSLFWAIGFSMYTRIFGYLEFNAKESMAAYQSAGTIERMCLIFFDGLAAVCAIMVGNRIGAKEEGKARGYAKNFLVIAVSMSFIISFVLFFIRNGIAEFYNFEELSKTYLRGILLVTALILWAKASNIIFHMGILRAGGDTMFSMFVDAGSVWLIGVPIAAVCAFVFKMPIHYIIAFLAIEEITKMIIAYIRLGSGKWLNNLVHDSDAKEAPESVSSEKAISEKSATVINES